MSSGVLIETDMAWGARMLLRAEQLVDAGLRSRLRIDALDDHRAVQVAAAVARGQAARDDDRSRRNAAIRHRSARAVEDLRALADEHAHAEHAVLLDDHALDDLRARADEAVVLDDRRIRLDRLEHAADAHAAGEVHVAPDLRARADGGPGIHHRALVDV